MAIGKTGKVIRQGKKFSIIEASPDHRAYKLGYMIGVKPLKSLLSKGTQEKPSSDAKKKQE